MSTSDLFVMCCQYAVCLPYHKQVIKEEDLPLVQAQLLWFVGVGHFKKSAVTHQPPVGQR